MGGKGSLARRLLVLQLLIVLVLLVAVAAVGLAQADRTIRATESRQMLGIAEDVAADPSLRELLTDPEQRLNLAPFATRAQVLSGASVVAIAGRDGTVLTSQHPDQIGRPMRLGGSTVTEGRAWVGAVDGSIVAHVPVISAQTQRISGYVAAEQVPPSVREILTSAFPELLVLLGIASALGVAGSLSLAWWVKRQTLGLEPAEITGLVEHREAMLHGIREGVIGLDQQLRITLVNDSARTLLTLPQDPEDIVGRSVHDLGLNERLVDVLTGTAAGSDQVGLRRGKVLVLNRMPITRGDRKLGAVVTLRDRTELVRLQDQLDAHRNTTDTLRAQAHEFSNRLHTIAGLIELGEYDEVRRYVSSVSAGRDQWQADVTARISDATVSALLIAKGSLAAEQGVGLRLSESCGLGPVGDALATDLVTVLGNLVDNALDALRGHATGRADWIEVELSQEDGTVRVVVCHPGPGIAPEIAEEVFRHGFTTKAAEQGGPRGLGLAITRQICVRRGGTVEVHNTDGAVFTATLPITPEVRV
ncbi:sensor histidine kinase [Streptomyces dysideae]|uniref:histidine kinase n=1 Tax=Streptomyces dysideae TaxID=909626 RepID=A0A101UUK0_9ACTN|nr:sensor histidine kinase [Streptomyces dysideae]KUO17174.1 histidine kinase [Streptomyces dysideae]